MITVFFGSRTKLFAKTLFTVSNISDINSVLQASETLIKI